MKIKYIPITILIAIIAYLSYLYSKKSHIGALRADPVIHPNYLISPVSCDQNSYGRGVGTIPINTIAPCPAGSSVHIEGEGDCRTPNLDYGQNFVLSGTGYVPTVSIRSKFINGIACCNGIIGEEACSTLCTAGEIDDGCTCRKVACKPGDENIAGLCYQACPGGWNRLGLGCKITCGDGFFDSGDHCWKLGDIVMTYAQRTASTCPDGQELSSGLCYPKCQSGWSGVGPICWAPVTTHPRESVISPLQPVQVVAKQYFQRQAIFEGNSTPPVAC